MNAIDEIENAWQPTVHSKTESMEREGALVLARLVKEYEVILDISVTNPKGETIPFSKASEYLKYFLWIFILYWLNQIIGEGVGSSKTLKISLFYCRSKGIRFGFASCLKNQ